MAERSAWDELRQVRRGRRMVRVIDLDNEQQYFEELKPTDTHLDDGETIFRPWPPTLEERQAVIREYDRRWYQPNVVTTQSA